MGSYKYVIIGGGLAGGRGADGIRKVDSEGTIALVAAENHFPYERPPLSKDYLMGRQGLDHVYLRGTVYYAENGVEVIRGTRATQVDRADRSVALADGRALEYEKLLLATGGHAWRLPLDGASLPGVFTLRTIEDADGIRSEASPGKRALVLGGSFIGCEVTSSLSQLGLEATMVFPGARLLHRVVPAELSDHLRAKYETNGVQILNGNKPERLEGDGRVERVVLDGGELLDTDLVVMGTGIRLNTELAREAGLELTQGGAILVDEYLRTSDARVYAAGDIATWPDPTSGSRLRVEHWDVARRQGLRAGRNMAGEEKPYSAMPYFFSDLFDLSFEAWGNFTAWDRTLLRGSMESGSFAFYYFLRNRLVAVLAAGRPDGERKPMQALVKTHLQYGEVGTQLVDETVDLNDLVV